MRGSAANATPHSVTADTAFAGVSNVYGKTLLISQAVSGIATRPRHARLKDVRSRVRPTGLAWRGSRAAVGTLSCPERASQGATAAAFRVCGAVACAAFSRDDPAWRDPGSGRSCLKVYQRCVLVSTGRVMAAVVVRKAATSTDGYCEFRLVFQWRATALPSSPEATGRQGQRHEDTPCMPSIFSLPKTKRLQCRTP